MNIMIVPKLIEIPKSGSISFSDLHYVFSYISNTKFVSIMKKFYNKYLTGNANNDNW